MVNLVKNAFYRVIDSRTLTRDTLSTFVCEVSGMMNGRPLTQVSSDFRDMEPITPNHFLLGRLSPNFPVGIFLDKSVTISSSWKQAQQISNQFRNRFLKEYMPTFLMRGERSTPAQNLQPGDVVCATILYHVGYGQWQESTKCFPWRIESCNLAESKRPMATFTDQS